MKNKPADKITRCAIYTRKSSEDGLEQEFNSLHAQREACEAYIESQKHEGWELSPITYDDGGFSGGNIERPALKQLMQDIDSGKIDIIVVYKVDRLTRSLADFAKLVDRMDAKGVSFVSITQQFNTTTSMGRLTLNVLLSFAQFEREVTGERIRDKIAMSKAKGKWMGGTVPTGYECRDHQLFIHEQDAKLIRYIFDRYIVLGSVPQLKVDLDAEGYRSKLRTSKTGREYGGLLFSLGNLARILKNRVYIGEIPHKGKWYPGNHESIVDKESFDVVQDMIANNTMQRSCAIGTKSPCLLAGKLFDDCNNYMTPKHSRTRKRHYRYYTSQAIIQGKPDTAGSLSNIPAHEIEHLVNSEIQKFLHDSSRLQSYLAQEPVKRQEQLMRIAQEKREDPEQQRLFLRRIISKVTIGKTFLTIILCAENLIETLKGNFTPEASLNPTLPIEITREVSLKSARNGSKVVLGTKNNESSDYLIKAIARAHLWNKEMMTGAVKNLEEIKTREKIASTGYVRQVMHLQFLAPDITEAILTGKHSKHLTYQQLVKASRIHDWQSQRQLLNL